MSDLCQPTGDRLVELLDLGPDEPAPVDLQPLQAHFSGCDACQTEGRQLEHLASLTRQALALWPRLAERQAAVPIMQAGQEQLLRELQAGTAASNILWQDVALRLTSLEPLERLRLLREAALRLLEQVPLPESGRFQEFWRAYYSVSLAGATRRSGEEVGAPDTDAEGAGAIQSTEDLVALLFRLHRASEGKQPGSVVEREDPTQAAFLQEVQSRLLE